MSKFMFLIAALFIAGCPAETEPDGSGGSGGGTAEGGGGAEEEGEVCGNAVCTGWDRCCDAEASFCAEICGIHIDGLKCGEDVCTFGEVCAPGEICLPSDLPFGPVCGDTNCLIGEECCPDESCSVDCSAG